MIEQVAVAAVGQTWIDHDGPHTGRRVLIDQVLETDVGCVCLANPVRVQQLLDAHRPVRGRRRLRHVADLRGYQVKVPLRHFGSGQVHLLTDPHLTAPAAAAAAGLGHTLVIGPIVRDEVAGPARSWQCAVTACGAQLLASSEDRVWWSEDGPRLCPAVRS